MIGIGGAPIRATTLPTDPEDRKRHPVASGVLDYFPDALVEISRVSWQGNEQHNPGQPLHWARGKSADEADTMMRHFLQRGSRDTDGQRHSAKMAWRALALLQKEIEAEQAIATELKRPNVLTGDEYREELAHKRAEQTRRETAADLAPCCGNYAACNNTGCVPRYRALTGHEPTNALASAMADMRADHYKDVHGKSHPLADRGFD